ncbi:MAG: hypothetical protein F6K14_17325 [Symploca sp. SIO2C1]|nr:hypothetical protein [Symploca sp. SIO2C1]
MDDTALEAIGQQQFPEYLRKLIKESGDRYEVLTDAIQEVHQQWLEAGCPSPENSYSKRSLHSPSPNLFAGFSCHGNSQDILNLRSCTKSKIDL